MQIKSNDCFGPLNSEMLSFFSFPPTLLEHCYRWWTFSELFQNIQNSIPINSRLNLSYIIALVLLLIVFVFSSFLNRFVPLIVLGMGQISLTMGKMRLQHQLLLKWQWCGALQYLPSIWFLKIQCFLFFGV